MTQDYTSLGTFSESLLKLQNLHIKNCMKTYLLLEYQFMNKNQQQLNVKCSVKFCTNCYDLYNLHWQKKKVSFNWCKNIESSCIINSYNSTIVAMVTQIRKHYNFLSCFPILDKSGAVFSFSSKLFKYNECQVKQQYIKYKRYVRIILLIIIQSIPLEGGSQKCSVYIKKYRKK